MSSIRDVCFQTLTNFNKLLTAPKPLLEFNGFTVFDVLTAFYMQSMTNSPLVLMSVEVDQCLMLYHPHLDQQENRDKQFIGVWFPSKG